MPDDVELTIVTLRFAAHDPETLSAILANYVVAARAESGCRNIDFCVSANDEREFVLIQKWASPRDQQAHFNSPVMIDMATSCSGLLRHAPTIELLDPISAHDLR
jgi:quinol monooxygenase YgiN